MNVLKEPEHKLQKNVTGPLYRQISPLAAVLTNKMELGAEAQVSERASGGMCR
jgi:hypothetical protein